MIDSLPDDADSTVLREVMLMSAFEDDLSMGTDECSLGGEYEDDDY